MIRKLWSISGDQTLNNISNFTFGSHPLGPIAYKYVSTLNYSLEKRILDKKIIPFLWGSRNFILLEIFLFITNNWWTKYGTLQDPKTDTSYRKY